MFFRLQFKLGIKTRGSCGALFSMTLGYAYITMQEMIFTTDLVVNPTSCGWSLDILGNTVIHHFAEGLCENQ